MVGTLIAIDSGFAKIDGIDVATDTDGARRANRRCFSRPVWPEQAGDRTAPCREGHAIDGLDIAKLLLQVLYFDHFFASTDGAESCAFPSLSLTRSRNGSKNSGRGMRSRHLVSSSATEAVSMNFLISFGPQPW